MLDALRDFYVDVAGLHVGYRPPMNNAGYWLYAGAHAVLHLSEAGPDEVRLPDVAGVFDHLAFSCTDRPAFEARLRQLNISFMGKLVQSTGQYQVFLADPAGNRVELNFQEAAAGQS